MGGSGPTPGGLNVRRPNLDEIEKIDLDALTGEIPEKHLSAAFKNAVDYDIQHHFPEPSICLELVKMLIAQDFIKQALDARAYIKKSFADYHEKKKRESDYSEEANYLISLIELELVRYVLARSRIDLGIRLADQIQHKESRARAYLDIFLAQNP